MIEVMRVLSAAAGASGAIFVDDVLFKSGRPWFDVRAFGAVGDGVTDDAAAINAAITAANNIGGGTVYFSQGATGINTYLVKSTINVLGGVRLLGAGINCTIKAGADIAVMTMAGPRVEINDLTLIGSSTVTTVNDTLTIQSSAGDPVVYRCLISGGRYAINDQGADTHVVLCVLNGSYGPALILTTGGHYLRNKVDQQWPVSTPASSLTINPWAASTAYTVGTVVSTQGFNIQCKTAGTSGGSAPTLQPYGINITDNTAVWLLVGPTTYSAIKINGPFTYVLDGDFTGCYSTAVLVEASSTVLVDNIVIGQCINEGIKVWGISTGSSAGIRISGGQISNLLGVNSKAIWLYTDGTRAARDVSIEGILVFNCPNGIYGSGAVANANWFIGAGTRIFNATTAAITIEGGVTDFVIDGCMLGSSAYWGANTLGIKLNAGATDYFTISNNDLHGATTAITNNLTSAPHGMIVNNLGYNPQAASAIAVGASPFTYTNMDPFAEIAAVYGGTVSSVTVRGVTVAQGTNVTPTLYPGDSIVVTYTVSPGMNKIPL